MKKVLLFVLFIVIMGIIGHYDMQDEIMTHKQDELNKQEVLKDMAIRCYKNELPYDMCKGL